MILVRTALRDFNAQLMNREIRQEFPAKAKTLAFEGFEFDLSQHTAGSTVDGRIVTPRAETHNMTVDWAKPEGEQVLDSAEPGEIRIGFDPDLTTAQEAELDTLLAAHVVTGTTPRQNAEDEDTTKLNKMEAFEAGNVFNTLTNVEQNQWISALTRHVLRKALRLDPGD